MKTNRDYIGPPCRRNHKYMDSNGSLRNPSGHCKECRTLISDQKGTYLGLLCKNKHEFKNTGKSIRKGYGCVVCKRLRDRRYVKLGKKKYPVSKVACQNCGISFEKRKAQIKRYPNHYCSRRCSNIYNNTHKNYGHPVSKLEKYIQSRLKETYPNLNVVFNDRKQIGLELDIFIPEHRLAFEINGIVHYQPIYGIDQFLKIQKRDQERFVRCSKHNIQLVVIDASESKYFKPEKCDKYFDTIKQIVDNVCYTGL